MDTSTAPWTPLTGLSATIKIKESPWGAIVVNNVAMTDVWDGWYEYVFTGYNPAKDYTYTCNPWAIAYIDSWVTDNLQQLISEVRVGWGGGGNYSQTIQTAISNAKTALEKKIEEEHNKTRQVVIDWDSETNSHIELAKTDITDKIESIEIPTTDLSDLNKSLGVARQQLTKLSDFLRKESENEKSEIKKEYEGKISELETTINGIEAMFEEFKWMSAEEKKTLLESKENELKEITEFADEAIEYYKEMKDSAKTEGEEEIKSKLKSLL